ncbi:pilus assembly PilX family protein [Roseibacillus persicicus]|uniref:pilus assembly PilX family protein n=1 Tax=Roseibacillus persicicus TaxID=454148 RepID=UPI00280ED46B|nr:hypothetical protein [Roseibacillus persicicus]MDQ8190513.1 hypothetical protein [Roseibacillus persicicus]
MKNSSSNPHQVAGLQSLAAKNGFSLIITVTMMILLSLIAVGLLSLSSLTMRAANADQAQAEARANARLAINMAVAELQLTLGDDRRVTANGSMLGDSGETHALGVWESWSPKLSKNPTDGDINYEGEKNSRFLRWLVSGRDEDLEKADWAQTGDTSGQAMVLFSQENDGFALKGSLVELSDGKGSLAWAVSQENTKAKINVAGPEEADRIGNDDLQAQPRPHVEGDIFKQPDDEWNKRAGRVTSLGQSSLDQDLFSGGNSNQAAADFTTTSAGLLTNVVEGGLKVDMSLGFEMSESDFNAATWSSEGATLPNPFHAGAEDEFNTPGSYQNQRPLYAPLADSGNLDFPKQFWPANVQHNFPVTAVPTFHSLRSYYRIPYHLYQSEEGLTVFERESDHIAATPQSVPRGYYPPPAETVEASQTQMGIRPVMDRIMFLISGGMNDADELRLIITPVITLWNPYNVALEVEGCVAHAWLDLPYDFQWRTFNPAGRQVSNESMYTSGLMSLQFINQGHGRSVNPYFYAAITADGKPLSESGGGKTISFEPGEVRVFAPAEQTHKNFDVEGSIRDRTVFLRPVDSLDQFSTKGGLSIPTKNFRRNEGFVRKLKNDHSAQLTFQAIPGEDYPFYISLEDATRARGSDPTEEDRGKAIADILMSNFSKTGETVRFESPRVTYSQLSAEPVPIGVIESYHRVASEGVNVQVADLLYTGNPRQPWMNPFITNADFKAGPQYQTRMRSVSSFSGVLQSANGGRSAYYGSSQTPIGGRTHLSFFEIPSAPLLSLAAFQHCDLSSSPYSPANQLANSWASAYVRRDRVSEGALQIDHCYLVNEALWDGFFFSGAAPTLSRSSTSGEEGVWDREVAQVQKPVSAILEDFFEGPTNAPLRNPRMKLANPASASEDGLVASLSEPIGCLKIAGELMVDGAFNVNSTSVASWKAILSGLRGASFEVEGNTTEIASGTTPFPRFRDPVGEANDIWQGFRTLSDNQIETLAEKLVERIRARGPFLSLGEFVNRRVSSDELGLVGVLQEAIDQSSLNEDALVEEFSTRSYSRSARSNISPANTGVGIPGYLTQADVLKPLASIITVRSDTFTVRGYGTSRDRSGRILAQVWAEATVQRYPDFVDSSDDKATPTSELNETNQKFGRRLRVTSFRYLSETEIQGTSPNLSA